MVLQALETQIPSAAGAEPALLDRLRQRACEFDFFQAVWLLERYCAGPTVVGQRGPVADERLRLRPDLSLAFPATDLRRMIAGKQPETGHPLYVLEVAFLGLYGVSTPLPLHYAVEVLRGAAGVGADWPEPGRATSPVRDVLDVVHHRALSLFYRAWLKYRYERMFAAPQRDVITEYLRLLIGCPGTYDEATLGVPPIRLLRYAGVLTQRPRSAMTLAGLLFDYWGDIPVQVEQFIGQWVPLDPADVTRLGAANSQLGVSVTVGDQVYDLGGAFNIRVGPVDWETYLTFVPGGVRFRQTRALTRLYCCDPLAFTFQVTLRPGAVPETQLTLDDRAGCLGLTSWVRTADLGETSVTFTATDETPVKLGASPASPAVMNE